MARLKFSPHLPPRTTTYKLFETALAGFNDYYWITRISINHLVEMGKGKDNVKDYADAGLCKKCDITVEDLKSSIPDIEQAARYMIIVQAVTAFEDYLREALGKLVESSIDTAKTYSVKFKLDDISTSSDPTNYIRSAYINAIVDDIMRDKYDTMWKRVINLTSKKVKFTDSDRHLYYAFESRNCIVHHSSYADDRATQALASFLPETRTGELLRIDELQMWQMLAAIKDAAHSLDICIR